MVNMKSLQDINLSGCERLENIPEIEGRMESLWGMDVSGTAITELPSSIGYHLFNLQELYLENCENLTTLPRSIFELQQLWLLDLTGCPKLKFECSEASKSKISHHGKQISSENDVDQGNLGLRSLMSVIAGNISGSDFLVTLGCASSLRGLNLSNSNFVSLPTGLTKFINLEVLALEGCKMLQEVTELPPNLHKLHVRDCVSLERISKLSSILKRQESKMFGWLDLRNCWRLCDNLVREAEMNGLIGNDDHQVETDLFSLFLSSQKSAFSVLLPGMREISKWFSCPMDFKEDGVCEFHIQVLANFKWENTGVALCVVSEYLLHVKFKFFFNEVLVMIGRLSDILSPFDFGSPSVLLYYIPFDGIDMHQAFGSTRPVPPFQCRVNIYPSNYIKETPMRSCGVHLVMPPNEACMKLSQVLCRTDTMEAEDENVDESELIDGCDDELEASDRRLTSMFKASYSEDGPSGLRKFKYDIDCGSPSTFNESTDIFMTEDMFGDELELTEGEASDF